ncbi:L,D-transpeptidase family protein [Rufibacter roseolus]|uniref:L,D-transpeptidase family protein n=1 Tax=Rufibacter roseolus TaxID=2817375 RepID=UPI001FEE1FB7|nr:L,D-transpeptidase family protein [Rufibacter roseolus]
MRRFLAFVILATFLFLAFKLQGPGTVTPLKSPIDKLVVIKSDRKLLAYSNGRLIRIYAVSLGKQPMGDKKMEGDNKTPEGKYTINHKSHYSRYHKNLGISYPNNKDRREAARLGKPVGGEIKIHGLPDNLSFIGKLHLLYDWTAGCVAVTNDEIDELFQIVPIGTPIEIKQ